MKDRRKCRRYPVDLPVSVSGTGIGLRKARLINLSATGAGLLMSAPAEVGTTLALRFSLGTDTFSREFTIDSRIIHNAEATVTQAQTRKKSFVVGCLFLNLSASDQSLIDEYVKSAVA